MSQTPYSGSKLAKFVEKRVLELRPYKTQAEIASQAGFVNPNMISMIKSGASKLALDRVSGLAGALEVDKRLLFKLACEQAGNETLMLAVEEIFGTIVTNNEIMWLEAIREASGNTDPTLTNRRRTAIRAIFGK